MANEITIVAGLSVSKGGAQIATGTLSKQVTMAGEDMLCQTHLVASGVGNGVTLPLGDLASIGQLFVKNLDPTNYVELATDEAMSAGKIFETLQPGEFYLGHPKFVTGATSVYARAHTAACLCVVAACEA